MHDSTALDAFGIAWRLAATLFFVALNGFFVAAEFALVKLQTVRIDTLADQGSRAALSVRHVTAHLDRYLSSCQLGITFASLVLGALGEPAVSVLLIAAAAAAGFEIAEHSSWLPIVSIGTAFLVITVLHMTVGEQAPKMWALRRAESTALWTVYPLRVFSWIFGPFIIAINALSNWMLRLAGLPASSEHETGHTAEEIRSILSLSANAGHITDREVEITQNVFRIASLEVRHIVVPRVEVAYLTLAKDLATNLEQIRESEHSRLPLCEEGLDTVIGFVHSNDVLRTDPSGSVAALRSIAREPLFVSDTMGVSAFLRELQTRRQHCAVVLDEHGTAIGLAFREDALEEIVGPLGDEFDEAEHELTPLPGGAFELRGRMSMPEVCDRLEFQLEEDEGEETIGGYVTAVLGRLPQQGDTAQVGPYLATITEVVRRSVHRVRLAPHLPENEDADANEG